MCQRFDNIIALVYVLLAILGTGHFSSCYHHNTNALLVGLIRQPPQGATFHYVVTPFQGVRSDLHSHDQPKA
jgi:hypothetical protein